MPSLPDLHDDAQTVVSPAVGAAGLAPADVLARVKSEGLRRRNRRHRRNAALAMLGVVAVAIPAVALLPGGDTAEDVRVASSPEGRSSTSDEAPATSEPPLTIDTATTVPEVVVDPALPPASTPDGPVATTVPAPVPTTAAPAPACRNSTDPVCGDFRWDPAPAPNQALTASFTSAPATAAVGEPVTFELQWSDPDAVVSYEHFAADGAVLARSCVHERRAGPWTPPAASPGSGTQSYSHTFDTPGTYEVAVYLATNADPAFGCDDPYASEAFVTHTITVA